MTYRTVAEHQCPTCHTTLTTTNALMCDGCSKTVTISAPELGLWTHVQAHNGHVHAVLDLCPACVPTVIVTKLSMIALDLERRLAEPR